MNKVKIFFKVLSNVWLLVVFILALLKVHHMVIAGVCIIGCIIDLVLAFSGRNKGND